VDITGAEVMVAAGVPMVMAMGTGIRTIAILATGIVLLGFALFALDEMDRGSQNQQNALASELENASERQVVVSPDSREERMREQRNGDVREVIDDANDVLLAPFADLVDSENAWVANGVPTILGLLVYGLLLGLVANMLPKQRAQGGDWRTA
jgi:uncharacterized membrane protein YhiD involved in acid resistance